ncbi:PRC-barrel domain-containing protein [Parapusillimonas granuli]|uniref:PRC-barrel domain-containing protein n=1 Tax=Parapusillimonas granuli TaxID=380911 RepID=A0A853G128_9BURK|nr:PRC-barrel domain-containing protein [Parapusillimonas granuli]MBB5213694.1 sporulation protein YlmC with PRC-barrel domain [Parapusillimonas granuli]MEB2398785.1 PRC-barrel domain-containing protein [Alcaligenaceae bacterium]NYT48531.1 PRC-barrel domain-containing protein [Parapusillimonas granuli]
MKKLLAATLCSLCTAAVPAAFAQTTAPAPTNPTAPGSPAVPGSPASPATPPAAPGATPPAGSAAAPAAEAKESITGLSVKKKIMGKTVVNENDEKIGEINDVVLAADGKAIYFIVGAGGFLGMGERDVAIPFKEINQTGDKLVLSGYTKDQLKALPKVEVAG